jgi:uncharacterized protein YndB with AHSA1/START domain
MAKDRLRVTAVIPASPENIYRAWLDGNEHSAFTGSRATVDPHGRFTAWDGYIQGTTVDRHPGRRIVQTWRTTEFPKGSSDSRLEIQLERVADGTRMTLIHTDIPEGQGEQYKTGWNTKYFVPMKAYFGKYLKPEPARKPAPRAAPSTQPPAIGALAMGKPAPKPAPAKAKAVMPTKKAKPTEAAKPTAKPTKAAKKPVVKAAAKSTKKATKKR